MRRIAARRVSRSVREGDEAMMPGALAVLTLVGLTLAAVFAFGWAARRGQFRNVNAGARVIFTPDEPEGRPTDSFPGQTSVESVIQKAAKK